MPRKGAPQTRGRALRGWRLLPALFVAGYVIAFVPGCGSGADASSLRRVIVDGEILVSLASTPPSEAPIRDVATDGVTAGAEVNRGRFGPDELVPYGTPIEGPCARDGQADVDLGVLTRREVRPAGAELRTTVFGPGLSRAGLDLVPRAGPGGVITRIVRDPRGRIAPGDVVRLAVSGGPDFTVDLPVPAMVVIAVGDCRDATCPAPPRGRDLVVRWPPAPSTAMHLEVRDESRSILRCREDGAAGQTTLHARYLEGASVRVVAHLDAESLVRRAGWSTLFTIVGAPRTTALRTVR